MAHISIVIPTFNRHAELQRTLGYLQEHSAKLLNDDSQEYTPDILVIDNASDKSVTSLLPKELVSMRGLRVIRLDENQAAAARNIGAKHASGDWVMMLDDDSTPTGGLFNSVISSLPPDVHAIGGEILLPDNTHEHGGLPEVVVGCGCLYRKDAFINVGGYDSAFEYYVEEYDLCAKLIRLGGRVAHTRSLVFEHRKVQQNRDFHSILRRLVRNNSWVIDRHCPSGLRDHAKKSMLDRYEQIARKNDVHDSYVEGVLEADNKRSNSSSPLSQNHWDRFVGKQAVRDSLLKQLKHRDIQDVQMVCRGKGAESIEEVLHEAGINITDSAEHKVISTLSPGPMIDAHNDDPNSIIAWDFSSSQVNPTTSTIQTLEHL